MFKNDKQSISDLLHCYEISRITFQNFLGKFFKINAGIQGTAVNIKFDPALQPDMLQDMILSVGCSNKRSRSDINRFEYFKVESDETLSNEGNDHLPLYFFIILDIYSKTIDSIIKGSSLIAFYVGIVLLIGFRLKSALEVKLESIKYTTIVENRFILTLIETIEIARADKNFVKEKLLFIYLLEILRSENLFNKISGSLKPSKYKDRFKDEFID